MEYKEFYQRLKENALPACLLMHGEEEYLKQRALESLRKAYLPEGLEVMNEAVFEGAAEENVLIEACETLPFMGEKRLVIAKEHPLIAGGAGGDGSRLADYVRAMPPHAALVFYVRGGADMRKKLPSAISKAGGAALFRMVDDKDLFAFLARECKAAGLAVGRAAMERLVFLCGRDLSVLSGEIRKIIAYAGNKESVSAEDVDQIAVPCLEANVYHMVDALLDGNAAHAHELKAALLRDGESPIRILSVLTSNLRQLSYAKIMLDAARPKPEIERAIGVSGFIAGKILTRASRLDARRVLAAERLCAQADYEIKSGAYKEDAALDRAMLSLDLSIRR